ncbi:MAG: NADPH-dependent reductase BacG, partial [Bacteroidota bacterium]
MNLSLINKNALVGGGSKGIGFASAVELALLGANVTLMARSLSDLERAIAALDTAKGQQHDYLCVDYSEPDTLKTTVEAYCLSKNIHILVNNTGGPAGGAAHLASIGEYLSAF